MLSLNGAQERTRTSTPLRELAPEASASANSATWAFPAAGKLQFILPRAPGFVNAADLSRTTLRSQFEIHRGVVCHTRVKASTKSGAKNIPNSPALISKPLK